MVFQTKCWKVIWPTSARERVEWIGRSRQSIGYVNSSGISTHPQCYCVCVYRKRATAEEGLNHPWLNSLPHPHSHPHLHARSASSLDEPETSQSESEPESPAPSPELDLIGSYLMCPGQGELKTGRDAFSFSEPPFPTRTEIQQELICWATFHRWREIERIQTPRSRRWMSVSLQLLGLDRTQGHAIWMLYACFYCCDVCELGCVYFDTSACVCLNNTRFSVLIYDCTEGMWEEWRCRRKGAGEDAQRFCRRTALLP